MTNEEFRALAEDARNECNHVDNETLCFGPGSLTELHNAMLHVIENEDANSARVKAAKKWMVSMANEWRANNENSN